MKFTAAFLLLLLLPCGLASSQVPEKRPLALTPPAVATRANGFCNPCIQLSEQSLDLLLNYVLNAGVIEGCGKLCKGAGLNNTAEKLCDVVCSVVGIKAFVKALNHTDLDPVYFCEEIKACPMGNPHAKAAITALKSVPPSVPVGGSLDLELDFTVTNTTGNYRTLSLMSIDSSM